MNTDNEIEYALSIRQPWAWLILHGGKDIENRTWTTRFRGRVLVHAGQGMTRAEYEEAGEYALLTNPQLKEFPRFEDLERGGIVGAVELVGCVAGSASPWFAGPYGFVLRNPVGLPFRKCRGSLGFFKVEGKYG